MEIIPHLPRVMDGKSGALKIGHGAASVVIFENSEITTLIAKASQRTKLYILLMLNCGMTQKDISDLLHEEVDWKAGRITRKRSKKEDEDQEVTEIAQEDLSDPDPQ